MSYFNWEKILKNEIFNDFFEEFDNQEVIVNDFLDRFSINQNQFVANAEFMNIGMIDLYMGDYQPSDSILYFGNITKRPRAYPYWFIAAFPDVLIWYLNNNDTISLISKATKKPADYINSISCLSNGHLKYDILLDMIHFYLLERHVNSLECSSSPNSFINEYEKNLMDGFLSELSAKDRAVSLLNSVENILNKGNKREAIDVITKSIEIFPIPQAYLLRGIVKCELKMNGCDDLRKAINLGVKGADDAFDVFCK